MNIKVMYHSSSGNTKKLAQAISESLGITAQEIGDSTVLTEQTDLLFIGDGIYYGKPHKKTQAFIEKLSPDMVKHAAVFATFGGQDKIGREITGLLEEKGITVIGKPYLCKGQSWLIANRNHPDAEDLFRAKEFAKEIAEKIK